MTVTERVNRLARQLYPTGRAFKMPPDGELEKYHQATSESTAQAYSDASDILNSILPDNDLFLDDDATAWERRLGLITNPMVPLVDRKAAILRKMNHPGTVPARENWRFLEYSLQQANFNVYVFENKFSDGMGGFITKTPQELSGSGGLPVQHGQRQHGQFQHGAGIFPKVVNYIDQASDSAFNLGANLRSTLFIGGDPVGTFADVDAEREQEFRQLILKIKPVQTVAFLFINYI